MKSFLIKIWAYSPYKKEKTYIEEASMIHTAVSKAMKKYKKEIIKRGKVEKYYIEII